MEICYPEVNDMRFDILKYLIDIDETHSINATAQHFFISQPAISNAIVNLEKVWA